MPPSDQHTYFAQLADQLARRLDDGHARLREDLVGLRGDVGETTKAVNAMALRINTLETERAIEKAQAIQRGAWAGTFAGLAMTMLIEMTKLIWPHR